MYRRKFRSPLPGFAPALSVTALWLFGWLVLPLIACLAKAATLPPTQFLAAAWSKRAQSAYGLTFGASAAAAGISVALGLLIAWVLVRYQFPGKKVVDALVDLPFALPTAVAGIALSALYAGNGWIGQYFESLGIQMAYNPKGIAIALIFIGLPFVVRTVQPVLEDFEKELEEARLLLLEAERRAKEKASKKAGAPGVKPGAKPVPYAETLDALADKLGLQKCWRSKPPTFGVWARAFGAGLVTLVPRGKLASKSPSLPR
mgnify:CR=1 FL=1